MNQAAGFTALVPIKRRSQCKTRLAYQLSDNQRLELARAMLHHVLTTLRQIPEIHSVVVLSEERDQVPADIEVMPEQGKDLNSSLQGAIDLLRDRGVQQVLLLPADLARLEPGDVQSLLDAAVDNKVAIAPSADEAGTNGMVLSTALPLRFAFGPDSFQKHLRAIVSCGADYEIVRTQGLGFDLDTIADLDQCVSATTALELASIQTIREAIG